MTLLERWETFFHMSERDLFLTAEKREESESPVLGHASNVVIVRPIETVDPVPASMRRLEIALARQNITIHKVGKATHTAIKYKLSQKSLDDEATRRASQHLAQSSVSVIQLHCILSYWSTMEHSDSFTRINHWLSAVENPASLSQRFQINQSRDA